jgi:hypothetical protein
MPDGINTPRFRFTILQEIRSPLISMTSEINTVPNTARTSARKEEGSGIYRTKIPMVPKITMDRIQANLPNGLSSSIFIVL